MLFVPRQPSVCEGILHLGSEMTRLPFVNKYNWTLYRICIHKENIYMIYHVIFIMCDVCIIGGRGEGSTWCV